MFIDSLKVTDFAAQLFLRKARIPGLVMTQLKELNDLAQAILRSKLIIFNSKMCNLRFWLQMPTSHVLNMLTMPIDGTIHAKYLGRNLIVQRNVFYHGQMCTHVRLMLLFSINGALIFTTLLKLYSLKIVISLMVPVV